MNDLERAEFFFEGCSCDESYKGRNLEDPNCLCCNLKYDVASLIQQVRKETEEKEYKRGFEDGKKQRNI